MSESLAGKAGKMFFGIGHAPAETPPIMRPKSTRASLPEEEMDPVMRGALKKWKASADAETAAATAATEIHSVEIPAHRSIDMITADIKIYEKALRQNRAAGYDKESSPNYQIFLENLANFNAAKAEIPLMRHDK